MPIYLPIYSVMVGMVGSLQQVGLLSVCKKFFDNSHRNVKYLFVKKTDFCK